MKKRHAPDSRLLLVVLLGTLFLLLAGCESLMPLATAEPGQVNTMVAMALTNNPTIEPKAIVVTVLVTQPVTVVHIEPSPTDTPIPTETPTPEPTATATPTIDLTPSITPTNTEIPITPSMLPVEEPRDVLGSPTWEDTFDSRDTLHNWALFYGEDEPAPFSLENYQLKMVDKEPLSRVTWSLNMNLPQDLRNYYVEFTEKVRLCSGMDSYGFVFRAPDKNTGYLASVTCNGYYSLRIAVANKKSEYLIDWKPSEAVKIGPYAKNRIGIWAHGKHFGLYINGELVGEVDDNEYDEGRFGPFISSAMSNDLTVYLTDVSYWRLP